MTQVFGRPHNVKIIVPLENSTPRLFGAGHESLERCQGSDASRALFFITIKTEYMHLAAASRALVQYSYSLFYL